VIFDFDFKSFGVDDFDFDFKIIFAESEQNVICFQTICVVCSLLC